MSHEKHQPDKLVSSVARLLIWRCFMVSTAKRKAATLLDRCLFFSIPNVGTVQSVLCEETCIYVRHMAGKQTAVFLWIDIHILHRCMRVLRFGHMVALLLTMICPAEHVG